MLFLVVAVQQNCTTVQEPRIKSKLAMCSWVVKSLSLSKKKVTRSVVIPIVAVSLLAATIYYSVPGSFHLRAIAFALGPNLNSMNANSSLYSLIADLNVTFQNGTTWDFYNSPFGLNYVGATELNSTDIKEIQLFPFPGYSPGLDLQEPFWAAIEYAADWGIPVNLRGESTLDLGVLNVANYTFGFGDEKDMRPPPDYRIPTLNYTLAVNGTGYWDLGMLPPFYGPWNWHVNIDQIRSILLNTTGPASISFDLDLSMNVFYQITTAEGTQSGSSTVEWSGRWGTLQLLHDGDQLLGLQYSFTEVSLRMMAT